MGLVAVASVPPPLPRCHCGVEPNVNASTLARTRGVPLSTIHSVCLFTSRGPRRQKMGSCCFEGYLRGWLSGAWSYTSSWRASNLLYLTVLSFCTAARRRLPHLVESSCRIRLVFYTTAHDQICLDTHPVTEWLEQDNLQHSQPVIVGPRATP